MRTGRKIFKRMVAVFLTTILMTSLCPGVVNAAGNDDLKSATRLLPCTDFNEPHIQLSYDGSGEYDYYKFVLPESGSMYYDIKLQTEGVVLYFNILNENGEICTYNKDPNNDITVNTFCAGSGPHEKGTYYFRIKCSAPCEYTMYFSSTSIGWKSDSVGIWYRRPDCSYPVNKWEKIKGYWYYFDASGYAEHGWKKDNGKWYFLNNDFGSAVTGWIRLAEGWYYFGSDCAMRTGWLYYNDYWYYLKPNGVMAEKEYCDGYWLDANGRWSYQHKAQWHQDSTGWWYGDDTGWYARNQNLTINGKYYHFNASGYCTNPYI